MVQTQNRSGDQHDPIVARATAPGAGAIAIVRVDGNGTGELLRRMFRPAGKRHPADSPREAIFGRWIHPGSEDVTLDEGLTIFFAAPHSFTGNDLAELQCHGGGAVVRSLIKAAMALGARPAEPGEFTRRAFLNGRLDLAEAEAVADLVRAETDAAARAAGAQLAGGLSRKIEALRRTLIDLTAEIEARIDFPEEGIEPADRRRLAAMFEQIGEGIERLAASRRRGRLLREGARVALIGAPNVGKSSLLNALARSDRAIVTPHPGTTRDTVECLIDLGGAAVTLIDTAGLREGAESIERIGIERTRRAIAGADYLIEVRDVTAPPGDSEFALADGREPDLIVLNKIDLLRGDGERGPMKEASADRSGAIEVSALTGEGIEELEAQMARLVFADEGAGSGERDLGGVAIGERHGLALERARAALAEARGAWNEGAGGELVTIDLNEALNALNEILGLGPSEAVLDRIFERFCLGK